jgi:DNA-binding transcriptional ArsR family regulator
MRTRAGTSSELAGLLHPIRMRIVAELAGRDGLTAAELHELLRDVPQASLYRQLALLEDAELVQVVDRRTGRGPAERVFALPDRRGMVVLGAAMKSPATVLRLFVVFCAMMLAQFSRYSRRVRPGRGAPPLFRGWPVYATDEEFVRLSASLAALCEDASTKGTPGDDRRRRFFYLVAVPETEGA